MKTKRTKRIVGPPIVLVVSTLFLLFGVHGAHAGNKRIMSIMAAKAVAERAIVESVYGLKLRSTEEVTDMVATNYVGKTDSKTSALISGVTFEDVVYDEKKDIAQATAVVSVGELTNIDGVTVDFNDKKFKRVGFATSTQSNAGPLKALRAAELDAYKQLIKSVIGFKLESNTSVENFILKSDQVKVKVMATLYTADVIDYGWTDGGDAYVKMQLNLKEFSELIGDTVTDVEDEIFGVEGMGAQQDDFQTSVQ